MEAQPAAPVGEAEPRARGRRRLRGGPPARSALLRVAMVLVVLVVLVLGAGAGSRAASPPPSAADLPLGQVAAGMSGFGLTAGPHNVLERFSIQVLSIQQDAGPGFPLVLVRASGPFIDRSGGVSAGMSGSPVYLTTASGPRLLGAIGYVFPSADHDLALVTPIARMRRAAAASTTSLAPGPVAVAGLGRAVPAATPVLLSGADPRSAALLAPLFEDPRLAPFPVQAAGTLPAGDQPPYALQPGSPISVELVRGDVTIGAVGTVTAVDGSSLLAFGHPLLGLGRVALPIAPAFVTAVVPSSVMPFKLANSGQAVLGTIAEDRPAAVAGSVGKGPAMIPVSLTVDAPSTHADYHLQVAADERLYPRLIEAASQQLLDRSLDETTAGYAQVGWEIDLAGDQQLNLVEQADDAHDIAKATAVLIGSPLQALATNVFQAPGVKAVKVNVHLTAHQSTAEIVDVVAENPKVAAGASVVAHIRLQPYRQAPLVKTLSVQLPQDASGTVTLTFRGGDVTPKGSSSQPPASSRPRSFLELLDALRQKPQASELVVEMPGKNGFPQRLARLALPFVVTGSQKLDVTVAGTSSSPAKAPAASEEPGGGSKSAPAPRAPELNQPPSGTPPPPPEGPKPNGAASSGALLAGAEAKP